MKAPLPSSQYPGKSNPLLEEFNRVWIECLDVLRAIALFFCRRFPCLDVDDILSEAYLKIVASKLEAPADNPLDLSRLVGYAQATMKSVVYDSVRRICRDQNLKMKLARDFHRLAASALGNSDSWRRQFREALEQAWETADLAERDLGILRTWLTVGRSRTRALRILRLCSSEPKTITREYDQPKHKALTKLRAALHPAHEWIREGDRLLVSEELACFLNDRLGLPQTEKDSP